MGFMYSWSNIRRVLFSVAKLLAYMYTYTHTTKSTSVFVLGIVSMTSVDIRDVAECCCGPFSHRTCTWPTALPSLFNKNGRLA